MGYLKAPPLTTYPVPLLGEFFDQMPQFRQDQFLHRHSHGILGTWGGEEDTAFDDAGCGATHDGRGADVLAGQVAEDLAESHQPFFEHCVVNDGIRRNV